MHSCSAAYSLFNDANRFMIISIEAMHLLPQSFEAQTVHSSSQGTSAGTAALLLPAVVRFFSKSLPHLLPRQAFPFLDLAFLPNPQMPSCFQALPSQAFHQSLFPCIFENIALAKP